jgi:hypothetical protein
MQDEGATTSGGCLCGAVRYEVRGDGFHATLCHCSSCRRATGAPAVAWVSFPAGALRFTRGTPRRFRSSAAVERSFCAGCGTPLTYQHDSLPDEIDVTTCSLDDPAAFPPADHTWTSERVGWHAAAHELPAFARARRG